jgi:hypothetical protein
MVRAQLEGEASGLAWVCQKARNRLSRTAQELEAVTAMLDAQLTARANRRTAHSMLKRVA